MGLFFGSSSSNSSGHDKDYTPCKVPCMCNKNSIPAAGYVPVGPMMASLEFVDVYKLETRSGEEKLVMKCHKCSGTGKLVLDELDSEDIDEYLEEMGAESIDPNEKSSDKHDTEVECACGSRELLYVANDHDMDEIPGSTYNCRHHEDFHYFWCDSCNRSGELEVDAAFQGTAQNFWLSTSGCLVELDN